MLPHPRSIDASRALLGLLSACVLLAVSLPAVAGTIRVPRDQRTIQKAIDAAKDGDTIKVKPGIYVEDLVIDRIDRLTLVGEGKPIIDGRALTTLLIRRSEDVEITGFKFVNSAESEPIVHILESEGVEIEKSSVGPGGGVGILVEDSSDVELSKLKVRKTAGDCIEFAGEGEMTDDSRIEKSDVDGCGAGGIRVTGDRNRVEKNKVSGVERDGISIDGGRANRITKNTVTRSGSDGIDVDSSDNRVEGNKVTRSGDAGVDVSVGSNLFKKNKITKSQTCGINDTSGLDTNIFKKNKADGVCPEGF